jgi:pSer/pThr/pTyr-binding forkhead associated (FHA) protein
MDDVIVVSQEGRTPLHVVVVGHLDIGRECDGLLVVDQRVSRLHLRLELVDGQMVVADLGSSNGTFLDGLRIRAPVVLEPYSTITLGTTSIRLQEAATAEHADREPPAAVDLDGLRGQVTNLSDGIPAPLTASQSVDQPELALHRQPLAWAEPPGTARPDRR